MSSHGSAGDGSVFRRSDGRFAAALYVTTSSGKRKRIYAYAPTKFEARLRLQELRTREQSGIPTPDRNWRVDAYLDYWLANVAAIDRRPRTVELYAAVIKRSLKPGLGTRPLLRLSVAQVQLFLNEQLRLGRSIRTVQNIRTVLSAALTRAMREELITRNVARLVQLPTWTRKEIHPWEAEQVGLFLATARDNRLYPAFLLLALYGLRRGEVLGLRWSDIDLTNGQIHVRQQIQRIGSSLAVGDVKTRAGRRDLPLLAAASLALQAHRETQTVEHGASAPEGLVFTSTTGHPVEPGNLARTFHLLRERAGLPHTTVHHLRHTAATLLKNAGVPARDTQLILGHAHISTTQQIYQHGNNEIQRAGLEGISRQLIIDVQPISCQPQLSNNVFTLQFRKIQSGGPAGTRTRDTLLKSLIYLGEGKDATAVRRVLIGNLRTRLLGHAAVEFSCQIEYSGARELKADLGEAFKSVQMTDQGWGGGGCLEY